MNNMKKIMTRILSFFVLCMMVASQSAYAIESVSYFHHDALGSAVAATDETGNLLWTEEYKPYGGRLNRETASADHNTWYTGKQEGAYGLTYFGARWYDPELGRFMALDPVGFKEGDIQSFNRYAYAANNPYKYTDPDGKAVAHLLIGGVILVGLLLLSASQTSRNRSGQQGNFGLLPDFEVFPGLGPNTKYEFDPNMFSDDESESDTNSDVIINDSTKSEDKVSNAVKGGNQEEIENESYNLETLRRAQNNNRRKQRAFEKGDYDGELSGNYRDLRNTSKKPKK